MSDRTPLENIYREMLIAAGCLPDMLDKIETEHPPTRPDWDSVVLGPDDRLVLTVPGDIINPMADTVPDSLRGRVIFVSREIDVEVLPPHPGDRVRAQVTFEGTLDGQGYVRTDSGATFYVPEGGVVRIERA